MRTINRIVVHHSASDWGTVNDIRGWHLERGWDDVGYHYVITNGRDGPAYEYTREHDGRVQKGREVADVGAHARGKNDDSIGVCLIGNGQHTRLQYVHLLWLLRWLAGEHNVTLDGIAGHYELDARKPDCPSFPMRLVRAALAAYA